MNNILLRKSMVFAVLLLFITSVLSPITFSQYSNFKSNTFITTSLGTILYVGGIDPGNYSTIQSAIDDANPFDTVFVYNGVYYENIIIDKSLNLIGENRETTIIDGNSNYDIIISVNESNVNISNFKIIYGTTGGCGLKTTFDYIDLYNLEFSNMNLPILFYPSNYSTITNCIFYPLNSLIQLGNSNNNIISNCQCYMNNVYGGEGIILIYANDNIITNFDIFSIGECVVGGFGIWFSNNNTFSNCNGINNKYGFYLAHAFDNIIQHCNIYGYSGYGMRVDDSNNNTITSNHFYDGIDGIIFDSSSNNLFYNNHFNNTNVIDGYSNIWNVSNRPGINIIGGPYIGGNFWSDYSGDDLDGDGLGDAPYQIPGGNNQDLYPLTYSWIQNILIEIDIKPGDYPNTINPNSKGKIPVAILTTDDFDSNTVDPETVIFLDASPTKWTIEDVDEDGDNDMLLKFKTQNCDFGLLIDESNDYPYAYLTCETKDGLDIEGKDTIRLVGIKNLIIEFFIDYFQMLLKILGFY